MKREMILSSTEVSQLTFHKIIMVQMQKNFDKLLISPVLIKTINNNESVGSKRFQVSV